MPLLPELRVAAARYVLGDLPSWEMPQFADRLAELDICSTAISDLATMREPIMSDAGPLFEQILRESAIDLPSVDESLEIVLRHYVSQIASRVIGPRPGLRSIANIYYSANLYDRSRHYVGDSHGLEHLLASFYLYDDIENVHLKTRTARRLIGRSTRTLYGRLTTGFKHAAGNSSSNAGSRISRVRSERQNQAAPRTIQLRKSSRTASHTNHL